ncbi:hypothetical protein BA895_08050 [Humibacillus sp. DSM 29435]|uniref:hypothetical protein n=1 Tax=Humibacillus sp. DSM 29435 TaxID=1869167 RepID=UPI000873242F|nr:hypothetical protein [Humibacillus sp. DSM 29435]OFE15069.1 hypothetical protein BA895_08050 [Humibacillus sp. DSM 29435]
MSALAVRFARVVRDRGRSAPGWDITLLQQANATAEVRRARDDGATPAAGSGCSNDPSRPAVEVFVGDENHPVNDAGGDGHACFTAVTCLGDRRVQVRSCSAPPALLVGRSGAELVPSTPCSVGGAVVDDEHRLLVLSAAAYETLPRALVVLLREFPSRFLRTDPVTLLETLFADIPVGSAALISPIATITPADRRNPQESA